MIVKEEESSTGRKTCYADAVRNKSHMDRPVIQSVPSHSSTTRPTSI